MRMRHAQACGQMILQSIALWWRCADPPNTRCRGSPQHPHKKPDNNSSLHQPRMSRDCSALHLAATPAPNWLAHHSHRGHLHHAWSHRAAMDPCRWNRAACQEKAMHPLRKPSPAFPPIACIGNTCAPLHRQAAPQADRLACRLKARQADHPWVPPVAQQADRQAHLPSAGRNQRRVVRTFATRRDTDLSRRDGIA